MKRKDPIESLKVRLSSKSSINGDCIIWNGCINKRGYGQIRLNKKKCLLTHRASWLVHYGSFPKNLVLHVCDVRNCINIHHLKEGTNQDNTDDMMRKKRHRILTHHKGSKNAMAILNEELVLKIKSLLNQGKKVSEVSRILEQPFYRIYDIKRKRTWVHLSEEEHV